MSIKDYEKPSFLQKIGLGLPVDSKGNRATLPRTGEDWHDWRIEMRENYPIRYFLNEEFASTFIWPWKFPLERARDWVRYRTTRRHHIVKTGQEPGYMDSGDQMFYASFKLLKEFVEVEKAHMWKWCEGDSDLKGADAGVAYLKWEMGLGKEGGLNQAENAKEIYELYNWWMHERPNRNDPYEHPDWDRYYELKKEIYGERGFGIATHLDTPELKKLQDKIFGRAGEIEEREEKEDEEMFIRLAKVRKGMWT